MPKTVTARRTQGERSAETRRKILDATLEALIELGYAGTSIPEVCQRAGMSRGALLHHFPTKAELVIEAVAHLASRRGRELRRLAETDEVSGDAIECVFELMWNVFAEPTFHAALELWMAARSDPELREALVPMERAIGRGLDRLWRGLPGAPELAEPEAGKRLEDLIAITLHMLRGMALQRILREDASERRRLFELWKSIARRELVNLPG
ncbi:MAG: TetR/AcrR family transcriptional regulator [Myxococcales bacterium]|nr:TetR/AcrR family transcriptional regulator [Myxococcales bacterium]